MAAARKFAFDTVFAPDGAVVRDGKGYRAQYSAAEVEAERATAFEHGRHDESQRAENTALSAMQMIARDVAAIRVRLDEECASLRIDAAALALAAARRAAGAALDAFGEERIVAAVEEAMELLPQGPRLLIRVPTNSFNTLRPRLEQAGQQSAYPGALVVREDASLAAGEVTIDWAEGAIGLDRETLFARIEDIMARRLEGAPAPQEVAI